MRWGDWITLLGFSVLLTACAMTAPVLVYDGIGKSKDTMRGTVTAGLVNVRFEVSGVVEGRLLKCTGSHNSMDLSPTISMPVECDDGRKGIIAVTRENMTNPPGDGFGTVRLDDGSEAEFVYGRKAEVQ